MANDPRSLTPQQRLAISRRALVNAFHGESESQAYQGRAQRAGLLDRTRWGPAARKLAQRWWRRHPANAASKLARPVFEKYAREEPIKLVAAAAAVGALLVVTRPWRLLSAGAVMAAVFKSSDIADMVNTLLQRSSNDARQDGE